MPKASHDSSVYFLKYFSRDIWTYNRIYAPEIKNRINELTYFERKM